MHELIYVVLLAIAILWTLVGIVSLFIVVVGIKKNSRWIQFIGCLLLVGVLSPLVPLLRGRSPEERAKRLMALPPGARVVRVEEGEWSVDGSVWFRLPPNRPPDAWLKVIWDMNPHPGDQRAGKDWLRAETDVGDHRQLSHDPETGLYRYVVSLDD